jgi:hypothetical protein
MPKLQEFTAEIRPTPYIWGGEQARPSPEGAAISQLGQQIGRTADTTMDIAEKQDLLAEYVSSAKERAAAVVKLGELEKTGQPVSEAFAEYLSTRQQAVKENRTTAAGLAATEQHFANMAADLGSTAVHMDSKLAGDRAKAAANDVVDANGVVLQRDPALLEKVIAEQNAQVDLLDGLTPLQRGAIRKELTQEAAKNAVRGWISGAQTVDSAKRVAKELEAGKFDAYLDSENKASLLDRANANVRISEAQVRADQAEARRALADHQGQVFADTVLGIYDGKVGARDMRQLVAAQEIDPDKVPMLMSMIERRAHQGAGGEPSAPKDYKALATLFEHAGDMTPSQVFEYAAANNLSAGDAKHFAAVAAEGDSTLKGIRRNALGQAAPQYFGYTPMPGNPKTADITDSEVELSKIVRQREQEYRAAGKSPLDYYGLDGKFAEDAARVSPLNRAKTKEAAALELQAKDARAHLQEQMVKGGTMQLPDGSWAKYSGQGDVTDPANWNPYTPGREASGKIRRPE